MNIARIVIVLFLLLEGLNVLALYFAPASKRANGVGVFNAWEKSKEYPEIHNLVRYLVNWVAGTKLIFILLLVVIAWKADDEILLYACLAMALAISSFFWRLFPAIRQMDADNQITPKGYSRTLGWMILAIVVVFLVPVLAGFVG